MIKYQLVCHQDHDFEAWFRCSNTFDVQSAVHQIECPHCGSVDITKAVMAPKISRAKECAPAAGPSWPTHDEATEAEITEVLRQFRADVEARSEYVGRKFAQEARDMHFEEKPKRDIWGEATAEDVRDLIEDEIAFTPVPRLPEDSD